MRVVIAARSRHRRVTVSGMTDLADFVGWSAAMTDCASYRRCRTDNTIYCSIVDAGMLNHPTTSAPVIGLVAVRGSRKLAHLRATIVARVAWEWTAVEGHSSAREQDQP